ncbi:SDR family oxidoreductase [Desulfobulbus rhabdoformis]|uniref:SDR family NAD(P)-dependent oxidoreductase n=1 Tax=Desulfobulbus rhabdoformis TaxID=34032 RepID=UPI001962CD29|nr:SDR family oxidoreductase [Desulfobulbus rhabdoformis]MBM9613653.1 SDR family oxidoreductase [Desulfobulbus rhabdoformis]
MNKGFVIITGAAGGIGQAFVNEFANAGYGIIGIIHKNKPAAPQNQNVHYITCNLAQTTQDTEYAAKIFAQIRAVFNQNGLKGLVNNAATQILGGVDSLTRKDWQETLNVNLLAPFLWSQAFLQELETSQGSIINISSIHARLTKKNFVAYATSKAALSGMTRAMAIDLQGKVRVNAIEPAAIETEMLKAGFSGKPELYSKLEACHPQQRIGRPEEVATLCLSLIDSKLDFIHGATISIDGGISGQLHDPD